MNKPMIPDGHCYYCGCGVYSGSKQMSHRRPATPNQATAFKIGGNMWDLETMKKLNEMFEQKLAIEEEDGEEFEDAKNEFQKD